MINVTDINDKIYDAAPGQSARLAAEATRWYLDDIGRLGLRMPDAQPTAAETVPDQIRMIDELVERGFAYEVDGDVYYRVSRFPRATAGCRGSVSTRCVIRSRTRARRIPAISRSGRQTSLARTPEWR